MNGIFLFAILAISQIIERITSSHILANSGYNSFIFTTSDCANVQLFTFHLTSTNKSINALSTSTGFLSSVALQKVFIKLSSLLFLDATLCSAWLSSWNVGIFFIHCNWGFLKISHVNWDLSITGNGVGHCGVSFTVEASTFGVSTLVLVLVTVQEGVETFTCFCSFFSFCSFNSSLFAIVNHFHVVLVAFAITFLISLADCCLCCKGQYWVSAISFI